MRGEMKGRTLWLRSRGWLWGGSRGGVNGRSQGVGSRCLLQRGLKGWAEGQGSMTGHNASGKSADVERGLNPKEIDTSKEEKLVLSLKVSEVPPRPRSSKNMNSLNPQLPKS